MVRDAGVLRDRHEALSRRVTAVVLNDSPNLTDEEREEQLIELVKPMGYTLTFIN